MQPLLVLLVDRVQVDRASISEAFPVVSRQARQGVQFQTLRRALRSRDAATRHVLRLLVLFFTQSLPILSLCMHERAVPSRSENPWSQ